MIMDQHTILLISEKARFVLEHVSDPNLKLSLEEIDKLCKDALRLYDEQRNAKLEVGQSWIGGREGEQRFITGVEGNGVEDQVTYRWGDSPCAGGNYTCTVSQFRYFSRTEEAIMLPPLSVGQTWVSGNGDSHRTVISLDGQQVTYRWHADGEKYTSTAMAFHEWAFGCRAEIEPLAIEGAPNA